jgi:hypothetical protein
MEYSMLSVKCYYIFFAMNKRHFLKFSLANYILIGFIFFRVLSSSAQTILSDSLLQPCPVFPLPLGVGPCVAEDCNLVMNGDFETNPNSCSQSLTDFNNNMYCWSPVHLSPDVFEVGCSNELFTIPTTFYSSNVTTWNGLGSNFIGLGGLWGLRGEWVQTQLSEALVPGETYEFSMMIYQVEGTASPSSSAAFDVCVGPDILDADQGQVLYSCGQFGTMNVIENIYTSIGFWTLISQTFIYNGDGNDDVLFFGLDLSELPYSGTDFVTYIFVDDVKLIQETDSVTFTLPAICQSGGLINLEDYINVPVIDFSGPGVSFDGTDWYLDSSVIPDEGGQIIASYEASAPCEVLYTSSFAFVDQILINLPIELSCLGIGESVELTVDELGSEYFWMPSESLNTNVGNAVIASPVETTTYVVTGVTASGCADSAEATVFVNVLPEVAITSENGTELCSGPTTQVELVASGAYIYEWISSNEYEIVEPNFGSEILVSLSNGSSEISVIGTSETGCSASATITIDVYDPITINSTVFESCGVGEIDLAVSGGSGDYSYIWYGLPNGFNPNQQDQINLPEGNYSVTVEPDNLECAEFENFVIDTQSCSPGLVITNNTVWSSVSETYCGNILITNGAKLTIEEGSTVYFTEGFGFVLETGGDLEVKNSTLTIAEGCPGFWKGIRSYKVANFPFDSDKCLISIESSTVSYAENALFLFTINTSNPASTNWIWSNVSNSLFLNNKQDFYCVGQQPKHLVHVTNGNSTFRIDEDFPEGYSSSPERALFKDFGKPVYFGNCVFENAAGGILAEQEITALHFKSAGFQFLSAATNTMGINSESKITGFTRAIKSIGDGRQTSLLMNTDISAWRGVYFQNVGLSSTDDCEFYNLTEEILTELGAGGQLTLNNSISYIFQENWDSEWAPYGMYVDGALNAFTVVDNYFSTAILPGITTFSHGFIGNNTGENANRLYRNTFQDMETAVKFQGDNRSNNSGQGVQIRCNSFGSNSNDIRVLGSNVGLPVNWGIPHQQSIGEDNANTFTQSLCGICSFDDIYNTTPSFNYFKEDGFSGPLLNETFGVIYLAAEDIIDCNSFEGFELKPGGDEDVLANLETVSGEYALIKNQYSLLVDDGVTSELLSLIGSTSFNNALTTYYELLLRSPNLSEAVLIEALEKFELPNALLSIILSNNPSSTRSADVQLKIDERPVPFDDYQMNMVNQALSIISYKDLLESQINSLLCKRDYANYSIYFDWMSDNEIMNDDLSILEILDVSNFPADRMLLLQILLFMGLFDEAVLALEDCEWCQNTIDLNYGVEADELLQIIEIEKDITDGIELTSVQLDNLNLIYENSTVFSSSMALSILSKFTNLDYIEPILEFETESKRTRTDIGSANLDCFISPNPGLDFVSISCENELIEFASIYNQSGILIENYSNLNRQREWIIDITGLSVGLYTIKLRGDGVLHNLKFVKL